MEVPQWAEVGLEGVGTQEIRVWFDGVRKRERVEYGSGKDMLVNVVVPGKLFGYHSHWSYVKDTRRVCEASLIDNLLGLSYVFPQHTTGWSYAGQEQYENRSCNVWTRSPPHGGATNNFTFYADAKVSNFSLSVVFFFSLMRCTKRLVAQLHTFMQDLLVLLQGICILRIMIGS